MNDKTQRKAKPEYVKILNRIVALFPKLGVAELRWLSRRVDAEIAEREKNLDNEIYTYGA